MAAAAAAAAAAAGAGGLYGALRGESERSGFGRQPKEIQTRTEFAKTCLDWHDFDSKDGVRTVERMESSKGRPLVIVKERRMKCSSSSQIEWEEVTTRYRMCCYCQAWCRNKTRWCNGCRSEVYCSKTCQKNDWKRHKEACRKEQIAREERKLQVLEFIQDQELRGRFEAVATADAGAKNAPPYNKQYPLLKRDLADPTTCPPPVYRPVPS